MEDQNDRNEQQTIGPGVSRREFLKGAAAVGGAAVASVVLAACGTPASPAPAGNTPAASAPTSAPAVLKPKSGGKITWAIENDPVNLIPFGAISTSNQWGKEFMYDSLVEWDKDLLVKPALAEKWETPDAKTWIWHLRQGVKFHDGAEVTADDVKYSIDLQANPPPPGIKIAQYPSIVSTEVVDKYTVKFNMQGPDPTVLGYLAWSRYSAIVPKGAYDKMNLVTTGIGTGPFKLVEYIANDHVTYTRNKDFWKQGLPYLDDIVLKVLPDENARVAALRAGQVDGCTVTPDTANSLKNDPNLVILKGLFSSPRQLQLTIKGDGKPWNKKGVRQAMNLAINRQDIIDKVYAGQAVLTGPVTTSYGDWFIPPDELAAKFYKPDLAAAKKLMADNGFANGFPITLYAISQPVEYTQIAEIIKEQFKQIGIEVQVISEEIGPFAKRNGDGTFDFCSTGRGMRHDVSGFINEYGRPTVGSAAIWFNKGDGWKNDEAIKAYDQLVMELDSAKRHPLARRIQEIALDEFPHFTTVQPYKFQVVRKQVMDMYVSFTDFNTGLRAAWLNA
ncbi:MAG: ABC transporter substrate-binding protein [Chloroflexi bacterium]|nr:MAG: ABC transporter substrate-binding protein [Chloroflexota bacterium]